MKSARFPRVACVGLALVLGGCSSGDASPSDVPSSDGSTSDSSGEGAADSPSTDTSSTKDSRVSDVTSDGAEAAVDAGPGKAFPLLDPPSGFGGLTASPPITLTGEKGKTISRVAITNSSGPCIVIDGGSDIVIDHVAIGPCKGDGIQIKGKAARITIRDSYVHDTTEIGVTTYQSTDVGITSSWFARNESGGYFLESTGIVFEKSSVLNVQGPFPRGQLAQFDKVTGAGNAVRCNVMENRPGESNPEDGINMYISSGTSASPILVEGNRIRGGGPSTSGGGILLGDGGGSSAYQISRGNVLVDPGQYGTSVAGGSHMSISGNLIFGKKQVFTNVGIYVWDQYKSSCTDVAVNDNQVNWTNKDGAKNPYWDGGNCTALVESTDDWKATFDDTIIERVPDVCKSP